MAVSVQMLKQALSQITINSQCKKKCIIFVLQFDHCSNKEHMDNAFNIYTLMPLYR